MNVALAYGQGSLSVEFPGDRTTVIEPSFRPGLADERAALRAAMDQPVGAPPLREWLRPGARICILFTDITRATPNQRLIPWLLEFLEESGVRREQITLLNQLGTHRPNTREELETMLTPAVVAGYRVINHEPENHDACVALGQTRGGVPAWINREAVEADVRIVTGFIEPHFFAGFSGGPKGIMPGVAHVETVMSNHGAHHIGDPRATFGICEGNPLWEELRDIALRAGPSFLLNVTLNDHRAVTGVFAGDLIAAHRAGRDFVRSAAMQKVKEPFDVVVTTNSGYPLDMNLYQGVKGMSAAARIVAERGTIILAAECREGVPAKSPLDRLLREAGSPEEILTLLATPGFVRPEQWQAQIQALIQRRARVLVHSAIPEDVLRAAHLEPCPDIAAAVRQELDRRGPQARVAVLPQGPLTIPYLA
ncbi:MAG: nickel-dependent lactate racemase [Verrucomicrobia bacterium]|nr:nickel-dependent lactate racemase [Verrucomicrobiota bacterium]